MKRYRWWLISLALLPLYSFAEKPSLGDIAKQMFGDVQNIRAMIRAICIITGAALILGAGLQYRKYRQNPVEVRLSSVFMSLLAGIALIILAFIPFQF